MYFYQLLLKSVRAADHVCYTRATQVGKGENCVSKNKYVRANAGEILTGTKHSNLKHLSQATGSYLNRSFFALLMSLQDIAYFAGKAQHRGG
ncbi:MAG: hypothetical protein CVU50_04185 [Candidatus Cloacimonetes bacterium HGW-Cloacimonetes-3]|jgi:hypothetical protein|nr:MAG: hypothetical protein CVU50_04185 [Candidatus Cloacimonetes bacterium HGW-Cloacimonetes-3]